MIIKESYITLTDLRFHAFHGVMPQERLTGNDYSVSLRIGYPVFDACLSDEVDDTLNYASVYDIVSQEMNVPSQLLERVAYRIADRLFRKFNLITELDIKLNKLNPPFGADCYGAGIELHLINDKTEP
ncbi:dihydroneopterin aldolase [Segatella paludivivens]|uniref:dihydroneopterin aldolase n=1 Tax=Segatella paludivivens TaxID=185294 RepID=UPI000365E555|nr:dihydroneopterin aldolase [Segatella paludivivens]